MFLSGPQTQDNFDRASRVNLLQAPIDPAQVAASAEIREFVSIGAGAVIGERVLLMAGAVVEAGAVIGDDCVLHPRVVVHHGCVVGARCILHAGAVIGADGFGNAWAGDHWEKIPQIGRAVLGDDVEIGANTTIDRGALADTVIERGVRLDNLIHIAHNCRVGAHTAMAACVGVAGSTSIGANCMIGGAAMISGHLKIGDRVHISGGTLVAKNLDKPGQYTAVYPLATHKEWLGNAAHVRQLGKLAARVKQLEARLAAANATDPHSTKEPQ
jgi:UDP-3-O-[3-hydroxymyristoyl] glucosamine N-acyltransferase